MRDDSDRPNGKSSRKASRNQRDQAAHDANRESGEPGGGQGRRDEVGPTGVYPMSGGIPEGKHLEIRTPASWGQGERGAEGYEDSGRSGLIWRDGQLLGGEAGDQRGEPASNKPDGERSAEEPNAGARPSGDSRTDHG